MVHVYYNGTDIMLRNVTNQMRLIFMFTAMTFSLWFEWLTWYKLFRNDCCAWS